MFLETFTLQEASRNIRRDFLTIASTPISEKCTQCGERYNDQIKECTALVNQLRRLHGEPPESCTFFIVQNFHDFGVYYEAGIFYQPDDEISCDYALTCENDLPEIWDAEAKEELRAAGHSAYQPAKIIEMKKAI